MLKVNWKHLSQRAESAGSGRKTPRVRTSRLVLTALKIHKKLRADSSEQDKFSHVMIINVELYNEYTFN